MADELIALSKALEDLRSELAIAQKEGDGKDIKFAIEEVSLDLQLVATGEVCGEAGASVWSVFTAKAGAKVSEAATQKLSLKLKVTGTTDGNGENRGPLEVGDEDDAPQ